MLLIHKCSNICLVFQAIYLPLPLNVEVVISRYAHLVC